MGYEVVLADSERGYCHRVIQAKIDDLTILRSRPEHAHLLDIWAGIKVFSITWTETRTPYVVAFRTGDWERRLLGAHAELTWDSVRCSSELKSWLTGERATKQN
jgi:hypothetical protein